MNRVSKSQNPQIFKIFSYRTSQILTTHIPSCLARHLQRKAV